MWSLRALHRDMAKVDWWAQIISEGFWYGWDAIIVLILWIEVKSMQNVNQHTRQAEAMTNSSYISRMIGAKSIWETINHTEDGGSGKFNWPKFPSLIEAASS